MPHGPKKRLSFARIRCGVAIFESWACARGLVMMAFALLRRPLRSEEHTSELQSLMRISYAVFCLKKKNYYETYGRHTGHLKTQNSRTLSHMLNNSLSDS